LTTAHQSLTVTVRFSSLFLLHTPPTPGLYTLSLHDALPISFSPRRRRAERPCHRNSRSTGRTRCRYRNHHTQASLAAFVLERSRSEEHTSELQSHLNLVCRLLLEKKKTTTTSLTLKETSYVL